MAKMQPKYTLEFRRQMVELVRVGRKSASCHKSSAARRGLSGTGSNRPIEMRVGNGDLTTAERQELTRRREPAASNRTGEVHVKKPLDSVLDPEARLSCKRRGKDQRED